MTPDEVEAVAGKMTKAQRSLLMGEISGRSYRGYWAVGRALERKGLVKGVIGFFAITKAGLAVRQHLERQR